MVVYGNAEMQNLKILPIGLQASIVDFGKQPKISVERWEKAFADIIEAPTRGGLSAKCKYQGQSYLLSRLIG